MAHAKKGTIWISATLYTLIVIVAIVLVLTAILPLIEKMKERAVFTKTKDDLLNIDNTIVGVATEGPGSQRVLPLQVQDGFMKVEDGELYWEMLTTSDVVSPRTKLEIGHLYIESNADVNAYVVGTKTIINNSRLYVEFDNNATNINNVITVMKNENGNSLPGSFDFKINGNSLPAVQSTSIDNEGTKLGSATFIAKINSTLKIKFTLEGGADYLAVNADTD
ncbi:hypothetical protein KY311_04995 [Candidatus Woesearchaeota archaeon]|nr:hypothetical protein [Candidatus Woesearchaeota archaeon]MBW3017153.1 hypothetical protein [Candidatus Woesearchaeota archaeon]